MKNDNELTPAQIEEAKGMIANSTYNSSSYAKLQRERARINLIKSGRTNVRRNI